MMQSREYLSWEVGVESKSKCQTQVKGHVLPVHRGAQ